MPIEIDAIIAQMEWTATRGLSKFVVNSSGARIQIRRSGTPTSDAVQKQEPPVASEDEVAGRSVQTVDTPMAGICHLSGDNDSAPFVSVGDKIDVGQTICMIEAMKVMTFITATATGTVKNILVDDGASVNAGAALVEVHP